MAARKVDSLGIGELEAVLQRKRTELADLQKQREQLLAELASVDGRIAALGPDSKPARRGGRRPKVKGRSGPRGGNTLGNALAGILQSAGKPMKLLDIVGAVEKSDYPSKSKHLRSMISQTLSRDSRFRKVRRGTYKLA